MSSQFHFRGSVGGYLLHKKGQFKSLTYFWYVLVPTSHQNDPSLMTSHALRANICTDLNLRGPPLGVSSYVVSSRVKLNGSHLRCEVLHCIKTFQAVRSHLRCQAISNSKVRGAKSCCNKSRQAGRSHLKCQVMLCQLMLYHVILSWEVPLGLILRHNVQMSTAS